MASKRSRIFRSSSQGEMRIFTQMNRLESPVALWHQKHQKHQQAPLVIDIPPESAKKPSVKQPCRSIFQLASPSGSPIRERQSEDGSKDFLKACPLCKKEFPGQTDIYMYGDLAAFCSIQCRAHQMNLDGFDKKCVVDTNNVMFKGAVALARKKKLRNAIHQPFDYSTAEN